MSQINESTIATPGVYVTEIPSFPPSIAQVATAIPAFVGYTAKADNLQPGDLNLVPTRLSSMVEYQLYFGGAPDPGITEVDIDANNVVTAVKRNATYYMYDSLRMFFLNGGGICYIVSIGLFPDPPALPTFQISDFNAGLDALRKYDEPTLILFPDAVQLSGDLYTVQNYALLQCGDLQDRFCILDVLETPTWTAGKDAFRNGTGVLNLNYGAAYTPFLKTNLGLSVTYGNLKGKIFQAGVAIDLTNFTTSQQAKDIITNNNNLLADTSTIYQDVKSILTGTNLDLQEQWLHLVNDYQTSFVGGTTPTDDEGKFQAMFTFLYAVALLLDTWTAAATTLLGNSTGGDLKTDAKNILTGSFIDTMKKLLAYDQGAETALTEITYYTARKASTIPNFKSTFWGNIFTVAGLPPEDATIYGAGAKPLIRDKAVPALSGLFATFNQGVSQILNLVLAYAANYEQSLLQMHPVYKQIVNVVKNTTTALPPSGAIAGVYASVDASRGVWKAPANVSLNGVTALTQTIDDVTQGTLNIDALSGKSINAIRAFTGKGVLVWGARTLDGNSNDFRYVSVRRFLINVEESVKMASMQFVFEPNDGNTWVRIRAMIENYLTNLWRLGALAGSKPEQSFYVKVGLGQTMIFDDILNGKMIIEVGLAPVRPAEFIILRFSQIQQQA